MIASRFLPSVAKRLIRVNGRRLGRFIRRPMNFPTYSPEVARYIETIGDDVRYAMLALAIQRLKIDRIEGDFAELGVYQGVTSRFIHRQSPERRLFLFDTFRGFPPESLEVNKDDRFQDTSEEKVTKFIGDTKNVFFRPGFFPETAAGLEDERFALVMLDFDLYQPALDALTFFYPRLVRGAFFFMHDFNSPESNHSISRAAREYLRDKPEILIEIADQCGSAVFRKI
jgi:O-methyltransferase